MEIDQDDRVNPGENQDLTEEPAGCSPRRGVIDFSAHADVISSMNDDPVDHVAKLKIDKKSVVITKRKRRRKSKKIIQAKRVKKRLQKVERLSDEISTRLDLALSESLN